MKCCKLMSTVYLRCFLNMCIIIRYITFVLFSVSISSSAEFCCKFFFNINPEEEGARTLYQEYNIAVTGVVHLAGIVTIHMRH